ncbi:MAG: hypothetical protein Q8900_00960 [Bacillota bacterium]|nr:hypothetical protein [Bacillota bacterium]
MSLNNDERKIYENELKILRDHKAELKASEEKGIDTGENRRAIKLAENFLRMGLIKSI